VLPSLGIEAKTAILPAWLHCPVCDSRRLRVYHDTAIGGQWTHCDRCQRGGDLIELAAAVSGLPLEESPMYLAGMGIGLSSNDVHPANVAAYVAEVVAPRRAVEKFWREALARFWRPTSAAARRLCGLLPRVDPTGRDDKPGLQVVGLATRRELEEATAWDARAERNGPRRGGSLLPVKVDDPVLLVPHYDVPGRICGFAVLWSKNDRDLAYAYRRAFRATTTQRYDTGLGLLPSLTASNGWRIRGRVLCSDPRVALNLQLRHMQAYTTPLPLGAYYYLDKNTGPEPGWPAAVPPLVFWSPKLDASPIVQARAARGQVSLYHGELQHTPLEICRGIIHAATSWQAALRVLCDRSPVDVVADALDRLAMTSQELREFLAGCKPETALKIRSGLQVHRQARTLVWQGKTYLERDNVWYCLARAKKHHVHETEQCVSDAVVRIDKVIQSSTKTAMYAGRVLYRGVEHPFCQPAVRMTRLLSWAHEFLRDEVGAGLSLYDKRYDGDALQIAIQLNEPKIVKSLARIGWDDAAQKFLFRDFTIDPHGIVDEDVVSSCSDDAPTLNIIPPVQRVHPSVLRFLTSRSCESEVFWAVFVMTAYNVLAPARRLPPFMVAMVGDGATTLGTSAAARMGISRTLLTPRASGADVAKATSHAWPAYLSPAPGGSWGWMDSAEGRGVSGYFCEMPWAAGLVAAMRNEWVMIDQPQKLGAAQFMPSAGGTMLAHFLRYVCEKQLWDFSIGDDDWIERVMKEVVAWYLSIGGDYPGPRAGARILRTQRYSKARMFADILSRLIAAGDLPERHGDLQTSPVEWVLHVDGDQPFVWVPQRTISELLERRGGLPLDILLTSRVLKEADAIHSEAVAQGRAGWLVKRAWWNENVVQPTETVAE